RFDRLGGTDLRAQPAEAAPGQIEVEVVEHLDLGAGLPVAAERDEVVGARLRTLVADDAGLGAGAGLGLQAEHAAEPRRRGTPLGRILEGERRLRRVLQREPEPLEDVDEEDRLEELDDGLHQARSPIRIGSDCPCGMIRSFRSTVPSLRILSWSRINPYSSASG